MSKKYSIIYVFFLLLLSIDFSFLGLYLQTHPAIDNKSQTNLQVTPIQTQKVSSNTISSQNTASSSSQNTPSLSPVLSHASSLHKTTTGTGGSSSSNTPNSLSSSNTLQSSSILGGTYYNWANTSFSFRKLLTINHTMVNGSSALTNFPVLINLYDADLHTKVQASGNDIIFTDINGTRLNFELQTFNQTYNSTYAHLVAWVLVPSLSRTVDTKIFMYYGNPTIGSQQTPTNVWDTHYKAVYHFETDPAQTIRDSTNHYNATSFGTMSSTNNLATGYIGNAYSFAGTDKVGTSSNSAVISSFTYSLWFHASYITTNNNPNPLIAVYYDDSHNRDLFIAGTSGKITFYYNGGAKSFNYVANTTVNWYYIVLTYDGANLSLYINGTFTQALALSMPSVSGYIQIGYFKQGPPTFYFTGNIDEPRVSDTARSSAWIATEFNNQKSGTKFYQISSEDRLVYNLQYREKITIDHTKISGASALMNYPLLLDIYDTNLHTKVQATGNDIMFGDANGLKYNHQIDAFYQNYNATTAHLLVWIQIPSLSPTTDTVLYMYYGNATFSSLQSASLVWTNNYQAVWHLGESSTSYVDSTGHGYTGTQNGNSQTTGLIDYGQHFSGSNQNIQISSTANFNPVGNVTISGWFKLDSNFNSFTYTSLTLFEKYADAYNDMNIALVGSDYYPGHGISLGSLIFKIESGSSTNDNIAYKWTQQTSWTAGVWYYFTIVSYAANPTADKIFINGIDNTNINSINSGTNPIDLSFSGSWGIGGGAVDSGTISSGSSWFKGTLDEFHVSSGIRLNNWVNTSYNNQLNSKSFFSVGTEQSLSPTVKNFGVSDNGTGHPQFWANITKGWIQYPVISATLSLNGTTYGMTLNASGLWIYNPVVQFNDYYSYQIVSATDSFGNSLVAPTNIQTIRFNLDKVTPTVLTWVYDPNVGINGTFRANVSDTWGIIGTVIVTVTYCQNCSSNHVTPVPQVMKFDGSEYINNTMSLVRSPINFTVTVNDTAGNTFTSAVHTGIAPDHAPTASNLAVSPPYPYTTDNLVASWSYYDQDGDAQNNNFYIRWYKNSQLQAAYTNLTTVPSSATARDDKWYFTLQVYDGFKYSSVYTSPNVTILNSAPVINSLTILPTNPTSTANLSAYYIYFDIDNDPENTTLRRIYWYKNGVLQPFLNNSLIVGAGNTTKNEYWYFTIQVSDGTAYSSVYTSAAVKILNAPPTASSVIITPTNPHINSSLTASWIYADADGDGQSANWYIRWYKNSVAQTSYDNKTTIPAYSFVKGDVWYYSLRVFDGINYSILYNSTSVTILDTAPTASNVGITPLNPDRTDSLVVSYTYSDLDGDPQNSNVIIWWYKNNNTQSAYDNLTVLPSSALVRGDSWYYIIRVYDGQLYSGNYTSSSVTIVNALPTVISPTFNNTSVTAGSTVNITYTYFDADNDPQKGFSIFWYVNNTVYVPSFFNLTKILFNSSNVGNIWYYIINVYDGYNHSLNYTSVFIGIGISNPVNTPPSATNLTITSNPTTTDSIIGSYNYTDPDGDLELGTQIRWYKNGVLQTAYNNTLTIPASATTKGDQWYFSVLPKDARGAVGNWTNSSITIVINSPPTASNLGITPSNPKTTDNLIASWIYADADNDPQNSHWIIWWYMNGTHIMIYDNSTTLYANATVKGEIWYYTLRVYDGTNYSILWYNSVNVTILNTPPVASQIIITPTNPHANNSLVASWTYFDADSDSQKNSTLNWYINGLLNTTFNNWTTIPSSYIKRGEVWYYTLLVYDGQNYSVLYTSSAVQILDTAPIASNIRITPTSPIRGDSLTVTYNWSDIDVGDVQIGTQIRWYKNGVLQSNLNDLKTISGSLIIKGDIWNITVQVSDGTLYGVLVFIVVKIGNTPPSVAVFVSPGAPVYTNATLSVSYQYSDVDNDLMVAVSIQWYMNNASGSFIIPSLNNMTHVPASMTIKNEQWIASIRVFDGQNWSTTVNSTKIMIVNSPPTLMNIAFLGGYLGGYNTTSNITVSYQYFDADNDSMKAVSIQWYLVGTGVINALNNKSTLPSSYTTRFQYWYITIQVFDGTNYSILYTTLSSLIYIKDSAPVITSASINNNALTTYVATGLSITYTYFDADNDPIASNGIIVYWYMDGTYQPILQNMTFISMSNLLKGETWYYIISVSDGFLWSQSRTGSFITIINTPPVASNLQFSNAQYSQFILVSENITISYTFHDDDLGDTNHSYIDWYMNGTYQPQYANLTFIPTSDLLPGEIWYFIIIPSDGYANGTAVVSASMTIENVPHILAYGVEAINDTEGHYIFWFNVTTNPVHPADPNNISPTISFYLLINNSARTPSLLANYNGSLFVFEFYLNKYFNNYALLGSSVYVSMDATSAVKYSGIISLITSSSSFNFTLLDTAPPRVITVTYLFNNIAHPTNITFYVQIVDYGSGVSNATLYYYFEPVSSNLSSSQIVNGVFMKSIYSTSNTEFQAVSLQKLNSTYYVATVSFNNTVNTFVLFRIAVADKAGNTAPNAYPLGLDPNRPGAKWIAPIGGGIPLEQVLGYLAVIIVVFAVFSFVIIRKFRKKELVGLDIDLVLERAKKINESELMKSLDSHTLGVVISFFDQRHGPIPIMQEPDILRDNFEKLVELSDLSFSTGRFMTNFEDEALLNFDFYVDEQHRVSTVTYAFALDRPQARGGAENITLNILVSKDIYPLVSQFTSQFTDTIHTIHQLMNSNIQNKTELQKYLQSLRKTITGIVLAYSDIYGTTELLEGESAD